MTDLTISESIINFHLTSSVSETIRFSIPDTTIAVACIGPPGIQGIQGPAGAAGAIEGSLFAFNEVSPISFLTIPAGKLVLECRIVIEVPFDGVGAALSIGDSVDHESLLSTLQNNPYEIGGYYTAPLTSYLVDTELKLFMTPGTDPSSGSGRFFILVEG